MRALAALGTLQLRNAAASEGLQRRSQWRTLLGLLALQALELLQALQLGP